MIMAQSTPPNPRQAAGGAFQVINVVDMEADNTPPGRVTDLQAENQDDVVSIKFTAPGDDLDSNDKVRVYILKYSSTAGNLTGPQFNDEVYNTEIKNEDLVDSTLEPETGGIQKILYIKSSLFLSGKKYVLALVTEDKRGNTGQVSNIVQIYIPNSSQTFTMASTTNPSTPETTTAPATTLDPTQTITTTTAPETTTPVTTPDRGERIVF